MTSLTAAESWRLWDSAGQYRGPSGAQLLKPYRDAGTVRPTPYERFYAWTTGPLHWRLIVITERFEAVVVGPEFESLTEALLALPVLARKHGCVRSS